MCGFAAVKDSSVSVPASVPVGISVQKHAPSLPLFLRKINICQRVACFFLFCFVRLGHFPPEKTDYVKLGVSVLAVWSPGGTSVMLFLGKSTICMYIKVMHLRPPLRKSESALRFISQILQSVSHPVHPALCILLFVA